ESRLAGPIPAEWARAALAMKVQPAAARARRVVYCNERPFVVLDATRSLPRHAAIGRSVDLQKGAAERIDVLRQIVEDAARPVRAVRVPRFTGKERRAHVER